MSKPDAAHIARLEHGKATLLAALDYRDMGWSPIPLCNPWHICLPGHVRSKNPCKSPGKSPVRTWKQHQTTIATEEQIREWWSELTFPNVGVVLGEVSGMVDIDVDGEGSLERLRERVGGDLPVTMEFHTPSGGYRFLYAIPQGFKCRTVVVEQGKKQEIRFQANGAQTVMPPSTGWLKHPADADGHVETLVAYRWADGRGPGEIELSPAPAWLLLEVEDDRASRSSAKRMFTPGVSDPNQKVTEGGRNARLASLAGSMRRTGLSAAAMAAALLVFNEENCDPPLDADEVEKIANSIARYDPEDPNAWEGWRPEPSDYSLQQTLPFESATATLTASQIAETNGAAHAVAAEVEERIHLTDPVVEVEVVSDDRKRIAMLAIQASPALTRVGVKKIIKLGKEEDADIRLILDRGGEISLGCAEDVLNCRKVRSKIYAAIGVVISLVKDHEWAALCERIAEVAEYKETPIGAIEETLIWLTHHCEQIVKEEHPPVNMDDSEAAADRLSNLMQAINSSYHKEVPFVSTKGEIFIHLDTFLAYVRNPGMFGAKVTRRELSLRIYSMGFRAIQVKVRVGDDKRVQIRLWKSPTEFKLDQ